MRISDWSSDVCSSDLAGMLVLDEQVLDLRRSVDEAVALFAQRAADKGLDLRIEFSATMPTVLRADHGRVRQVLLNYLSHAVKFSSAEGPVGQECVGTVRFRWSAYY